MDSERSEAGASVSRAAWLLAGLALFGALLLRSSFLIDDAFISFRYARNWAAGLGLVFNPTETAPVEGYSNFLWVAALAACSTLGVSLELGAQVLAAACAAATVVVLERHLRQLELPPLAIGFGLLALCTAPAFVVWSSGGLETSAFTCALLCTYVALRAAGPRAGLWAGLAGLSLCLLRPEGFLFAGLLAVLHALRLRSAEEPVLARRSLVHYAAVVSFGFGAFLVWRYTTYGALLPNTVHAKASISGATLARGLRNTGSYLAYFVWPAFALATPWIVPRRLRAEALGVAVLCATCLAYNTAVGGDWMPMFRFLAPAAPFFALLLACALARTSGPRRLLLPALAALALCGAALPLFDRTLAPRALLEALDFRSFQSGYETEWGRLERSRTNLAGFRAIGRGLAQVAPEGASLTAGAIGALGYDSDLFLYDRNGLIDPDVAQRPATGTRSAGHDKRVPRAYFIDRKPTYFEALQLEGRIQADGPAFAQAVAALKRMVFRAGDEEALKECSVVELLPTPDGATLVTLRYTDDAARARAFWQRFP